MIYNTAYAHFINEDVEEAEKLLYELKERCELFEKEFTDFVF